jgi:primosomal protein N' (replication factor Y) (superfamily II helicase)
MCGEYNAQRLPRTAGLIQKGQVGYNARMIPTHPDSPDTYAEVAVRSPVRSTFTYHVPPALAGSLQPGHLVRVSFGAGMAVGIVLRLHATTDLPQTKPIAELLDPLPVLGDAHLALGVWLAARYRAPIGNCMWLMLPPGMTGAADRLLALTPAGREALTAPELDDALRPILEALEQPGPQRQRQLASRLRGKSIARALKQLEARGLISAQPTLAPPAIKPKVVATVHLAIPPDRIADVAPHLGRRSAAADLLEVIVAAGDDALNRQDALALAGTSRTALRQLVDGGWVAIEQTGRGQDDLLFAQIDRDGVAEVLIYLRGAYHDIGLLRALADAGGALDKADFQEAGATASDIQRLTAAGLITAGTRPEFRTALDGRTYAPALPPALLPDQERAWLAIRAQIEALSWGQPVPMAERLFLLQGVTGSGKTEIYLRAIELALAQGRQALFLVPEIALTPQTVRRVASRFPGQVALVHGSLSTRERYDTWMRARAGEIGVIVGTRSAIFTPLPDIGVIILDEEHDASYHQAPPFESPYYHARAVAERLAAETGGVLILGSATPAIETRYRAEHGELTLLTLPERIMGHRRRILGDTGDPDLLPAFQPLAGETVTMSLPDVELVDMRDELKAGNTSMFSATLRTALADVLNRGEQAMLLLNRRGQSTYVFCRDCGLVLSCARCSTPLTYHRAGDALRCHHCGWQQPPAATCPACGSDRIRYFGAGTQQVEEALAGAFPRARVLRWDADTTTRPSDHEAILAAFIDRQADVLIGTQMIAKGLDLPWVTLVGVVSADHGLALPDFRASERTFQLLTQVAGRAGRSLMGGHVVLQTYQPEHYAIQAAAAHDYAAFYAREIAYREEMGYPPYRRLVRMLFQHAQPAQAREDCEQSARVLRRLIEEREHRDTHLIGPAPCFYERLDGRYRWQIVLRGPDPAALLDDFPRKPGWFIETDPLDLL